MSAAVSTHVLGVVCQGCHEVLEDDLCQCGQRHGYGYQQPDAWAARTWPDHRCGVAHEGAQEVRGCDLTGERDGSGER